MLIDLSSIIDDEWQNFRFRHCFFFPSTRILDFTVAEIKTMIKSGLTVQDRRLEIIDPLGEKKKTLELTHSPTMEGQDGPSSVSDSIVEKVPAR